GAWAAGGSTGAPAVVGDGRRGHPGKPGKLIDPAVKDRVTGVDRILRRAQRAGESRRAVSDEEIDLRLGLVAEIFGVNLVEFAAQPVLLHLGTVPSRQSERVFERQAGARLDLRLLDRDNLRLPDLAVPDLRHQRLERVLGALDRVNGGFRLILAAFELYARRDDVRFRQRPGFDHPFVVFELRVGQVDRFLLDLLVAARE